jgi:hypothetical protein
LPAKNHVAATVADALGTVLDGLSTLSRFGESWRLADRRCGHGVVGHAPPDVWRESPSALRDDHVAEHDHLLTGRPYWLIRPRWSAVCCGRPFGLCRGQRNSAQQQDKDSV